MYSPLVLVVELGQAGGHLSAAGARGGDHHQGSGGLDILIFAVAVIADDQRNVAGIPLDDIVQVNPDAQLLQAGLKEFGGVLAGKLGDDYAAHVEPFLGKIVDEAQNVCVVGDSQIPADLIFLDIPSADDDDDLSLVGQLHEHLQLAVRGKSRQNPRGVKIVEELAAELQIQLVVKLIDALPDVGGLHGQVFVVVKSNLHGIHSSLCL